MSNIIYSIEDYTEYEYSTEHRIKIRLNVKTEQEALEAFKIYIEDEYAENAQLYKYDISTAKAVLLMDHKAS